MENNKILLFDNPDDFINFMDYLQQEYNKQHENGHDEKAIKQNKRSVIMKNNNDPSLYKAPETRPIIFNKTWFYICIVAVFLVFWFVGFIFNNNMQLLLSNCI